MDNLDNISNIQIDNTPPPPPVQNRNTTLADRWKISCEHFRYKRCISILVCIILVPIVVIVPTVLVHKRKIKSSTTATITKKTTITTTTITTTTITNTTTKVPLYSIITNTTKWKQNGITVFQQFDFDESTFDLNAMYIDDDETIYITEPSKNRIVKLKLNITNILIDAGDVGGDGTHQLWRPSDIIVDKKTDSIIICDLGNRRVVRWSLQNATNGDVMIMNIDCNGLTTDNKGHLYVTSWMEAAVRRWEIGVNNKSTIVAGGNEVGNNVRQLRSPSFIFIDEDYSLFVADRGNHRVMKWMKNATDGIVVAGGNGDGATLTQLSNPEGVVVDHLGNVYVADTSNDRVMRWINGAKEGSIVVGGNGRGNETNQLWMPSDLLFDKHGNLYVFDAVNHRIQKFYIESN